MDQTEGAVTPAMRHKARHFALQAIYQWQLTGMSASTIEQQFLEDQPVAGADLDYMHDLIQGVIANCDTLDAAFAQIIEHQVPPQSAENDAAACPQVPGEQQNPGKKNQIHVH